MDSWMISKSRFKILQIVRRKIQNNKKNYNIYRTEASL